MWVHWTDVPKTVLWKKHELTWSQWSLECQHFSLRFSIFLLNFNIGNITGKILATINFFESWSTLILFNWNCLILYSDNRFAFLSYTVPLAYCLLHRHFFLIVFLMKMYYENFYHTLHICGSSSIRTHNHLVRKLILNHLAKLAKWLSCIGTVICTVHLTVWYYHVTYPFQSESTLYSCLNGKELLVRDRRGIWSNGTWTHNHSVHKRTLNHLAKLAEWFGRVVRRNV